MVDLGDREPRRGPYLSQSPARFCFLKTWETDAVFVQHRVLVSGSELEYQAGLDGLPASGSFSVHFIFIIGSTWGEKCDFGCPGVKATAMPLKGSHAFLHAPSLG